MNYSHTITIVTELGPDQFRRKILKEFPGELTVTCVGWGNAVLVHEKGAEGDKPSAPSKPFSNPNTTGLLHG